MLMLYTSLPKIASNTLNSTSISVEEVSFTEVQNIIKYRCGVCHAANPTFEGFEDLPLGVVFDTSNDIINNLEKIKSQSIDSDIMPPGNLTGMTEKERLTLLNWIKQGSKINN